MHALLFWKDWPKPHRTIWLALAAVLTLSTAYLWFSWLQGPDNIISWERIQEQKIIETPVHEFRVGPFHLNVPGESYVIFEYLQGGDVVHNQLASYVFLIVLTVCAMVLLTVITTLNRFWYFAGMGLFVVFVLSLQLDVLRVFSIGGYAVPVTVSLIFVAVSYYFKSFRAEAGWTTRLLCFLTMAAVCAVVIGLFSKIAYPLLHLVITAYLPAMVLSIIFILMIAHEILASFVYVASQGTSKSLRHFMIISVIYLANILLACLYELGVINWDFIYVNLYLLLCASMILGIWGFRQREPLYQGILGFRPQGALLYLALASICIITIAQYLANANDVALKIIRDVIIFSHAGYGIIFLTYFISNFMVMMADNLPVYKFIYNPNRMPYFTFRLAGLIATLAFVFYSDYRQTVYHGIAGFYNYVADLYVLQGRDVLALNFYDESRKYGFQGHRANYALGKMKSATIRYEDAHYNYKLANGKRPSEFSLVNGGNLYLWDRQYFSAIKAYREGMEIMSGSGVLANNLGFAYGKIHHLDSATWFINEARQHKLTRSSAEGNFLALAASEYLPINTDSVVRLFGNESPVVIGNALALATLFDQEITTNLDPLKDKVLNLYSATLLNNYTIRNSRTIDTTFIQQVDAIANDSLNFDYSEALKATLAHAYYHRGNVTKALEILAELAYTSQGYRGKYNYIMGLWALDQGNPEIASSYFTHAETADYKDSPFYNAIALTEAGKTFAAFVAWDSVASRGEQGEQEIARRMQRILALTPSQAMQLDDPEKYQYCRYNIGLADTTLFNKLTKTFQGADYKAQTLLDMSKEQFKAGNLSPAIRYLNQISGLELTDKQLYNEVRHAELLMLAWRREIQLLALQINTDVEFGPGHELDLIWYTALVNEASGDLEAAQKNYRIVGTWNPYFEEGIVSAANFFRTQNPEGMESYNILVEAIQINHNSYRLLQAYAEEAERKGFDEYAASARLRLQQIVLNQR